jgi:hypothetical protein
MREEALRAAHATECTASARATTGLEVGRGDGPESTWFLAPGVNPKLEAPAAREALCYMPPGAPVTASASSVTDRIDSGKRRQGLGTQL